MKPKRANLSSYEFVKLERRSWQNGNLLAPNAQQDFQKLTDETFRELRSRYFTPADLVAEMQFRPREGVDAASVERQLVQSKKRRTPRPALSPAKRFALTECFRHDGLYRKHGRWRGTPTGKVISGMTIADLGRDGILLVKKSARAGSAELTALGRSLVESMIDISADSDASSS